MDGFGDLQDLYQQMILDHGRKPRNFRELPGADSHAEGFNPLCGDQVTVYLKTDRDRIADLSFTGKGCAICTASASMMTQSLKQKSMEDALQMFEAFHEMLTGKTEAGDRSDMGKLSVFSGVRKYPMRVKCATLPWHTLKNSIESRDEIATTE